MNKIEVKSSNKKQEFILEEDSFIFISDCECDFVFTSSFDIKVFIYIDNSSVKSNFSITNNLILNIFNVNSEFFCTLDLNKPKIDLVYSYSNLNIDSNKYVVSINHNYSYQTSKIVNHGINFSDKALLYEINAVVPKNSSNGKTSQDSRIILFGDNNSRIEPNLIIANSLIEANHSAYIGDFKSDELFYLESRGLSLDSSKRILAKSFLLGSMNISFREIDIILSKLDKYWR